MNTNLIKLMTSGLFLCLASIPTVLSAAEKVDIIFVMDTSGSLSDEAPALISATETVEQDLSGTYDLDTKLWSITNSFDFSSSGFDSSVINEIPSGTTNQYEDWGPATYDIATHYSGWRSDAIQIVIPISDEGPQDGNGLYQNDVDVINQARTALDSTDIYAVPVIAQGSYQDTLYSDYGLILSDKAIKTGSGDLVEQFKTIIADIVAEASGSSLGSVTSTFYESFNGGKLIIDAKGASNYDVVAKFDGVELMSVSTTSSSVSINFPSNFDNTVSHTLEIEYTAYATDDSGQILEQKDQTLSYSTQIDSAIFDNYPELIAMTHEPAPIQFIEHAKTPEKIYLGAADDPENQIQSTTLVADPVDISSGNFIFSHSDLTVATAGAPFIIKRIYNSLEPIQGWHFNIDNEMDLSDIENIKVSWMGGYARDLFVKAKEGWVSIYSNDTLTTEAGFYVVTKSDGDKYKFDTEGKLIHVTNKKDLGWTLEYVGGNIIAEDSFGNEIATINRDSSMKITSVLDANGGEINYSYDGSNLSRYTNRNGHSESYQYDGNLVKSITGSDGIVYVENTYDDQGRVIFQFDGKGNQTAFVYSGDLEDFIVNSVDVTYANGVSRRHDFNLLLPTKIIGSDTIVSFGYNENNKINSITDTNGKQWAYERNSNGLITKLVDPEGNQTVKKYDNNNLISHTNALSQLVSFEYDENSNLIKSIDYENKETIFEYNEFNKIVKVTNSLGQEIKYTYNSRGGIDSIIMPNGAITSYTYDALGNIKSVIDAKGYIVAYEYDKEGNVILVTNAMGYQAKIEYNSFGKVTKVVDEKNRTTLMEYSNGLLTKSTSGNGETTERSYDVLGRLVSIKDALGRLFQREYDDFGRVSRTIDPKGNEYTFTYDAVGNLVEVKDPKKTDSKQAYDELYRMSKIIDADGVEVLSVTYNELSKPIKLEDILGRSVEYGFDSLNRLKSSVLSGIISSEVLYDDIGRITQIIGPMGLNSSYEYDDETGKVAKETNALNNTNKYSYDILGRLVNTESPNGISTEYTYDELNRLIKLSRVKENGNIKNYKYDEVGNLVSISDIQGTINYTHNSNDKVTTRTGVYGNKVSYTYDLANRVTSISYPNGKSIKYLYDDNSNLVKVIDFENRETTFDYDINGDLLKTVHVNGSYSLYSYDNNGRLLSLKNYNNQGHLISGNELIRDSLGAIVNKKELRSTVPDLSKVKNFNFEVNEFNQVTKSEESNYVYDNNGNLLQYSYDNKDIQLDYNDADQLTVANIGADSYQYSYDAEGNRVGVNGKRYLVDNVMGLSKPLAELEADNTISKYYIWTKGLGYSIDADGKVLVYFYDYQGSTNAVIDMFNTIEESYSYTSYGSVLSDNLDIDNPFKYLGQHGIMSDSSSLYYVRARYFSPELNRWTQADVKRGEPSNPLSLNRYVLNEGDVVNFIDINGYESGVVSHRGLGDSYLNAHTGIEFNASKPEYYKVELYESAVGLGTGEYNDKETFVVGGTATLVKVESTEYFDFVSGTLTAGDGVAGVYAVKTTNSDGSSTTSIKGGYEGTVIGLDVNLNLRYFELEGGVGAGAGSSGAVEYTISSDGSLESGKGCLKAELLVGGGGCIKINTGQIKEDANAAASYYWDINDWLTGMAIRGEDFGRLFR